MVDLENQPKPTEPTGATEPTSAPQATGARQAPFSKQNLLGHTVIAGEARESVFPVIGEPRVKQETFSYIQHSLEEHGCTKPAPTQLDWWPVMPELQGPTMVNHFELIAKQTLGNRPADLETLASMKMLRPPSEWLTDGYFQQAGWTRYVEGQPPTRVDHPLESALVFDVETYVKMGNGPVMAAAVSSEAWYVWLHPSLVASDLFYETRLISLGEGKMVVNHNVTYDAARVEETYSLGQPVNSWFCTLSAHVATNGLSNKQRIPYKTFKAMESPPPLRWLHKGSMNSLVEAYNFHMTNELGRQPLSDGDKELRKIFVTATSIQEMRDRLQELISYCVLDVYYTADLFKVLWLKYKQANPSLVSLMGHLSLNSSILPVPDTWLNWIQETELTFKKRQRDINVKLYRLALVVKKQVKDGHINPMNDPWLSQLDWTPAKTGTNKGEPAWWRKLKTIPGTSLKAISTKSRIAPYLLQLSWLGSPISYHNGKGWCYLPIAPDAPDAPDSLGKLTGNQPETNRKAGGYDEALSFKLTTKSGETEIWVRIPHAKGNKQNCGNPLAKDYISSIASGFLSSPNEQALEILELANSISYWLSARKRVGNYITQQVTSDALLIIPQIMAHGATTRRATERLWLTVPSPKKHAVGSELKAMVRAPAGYKLVGSDFEAQEMRIASLFSDAHVGNQLGSTPLSWAILCGSKENKTDAHSTLAAALGIDRQLAKTLNFQMLYMGGINALSGDIKKSKKELTEEECQQLANKGIRQRRGVKKYSGPYGGKDRRYQYVGGTDSHAYNFMLKLCNDWPLPEHLKHLGPRMYTGSQVTPSRDGPRTVMLGARMSEALWSSNCGGDYLTSRANATIQGTGVDILHCFLTAINWLFDHYQVKARFIMSYHDEVWAIAEDGYEIKTAACFQIAHIWAWALLSERLGLNDLPINGVWFPEVNIDTVWRKEVDMSILTPSNDHQPPNGIGLKPKDCFEGWPLL